jgi:hypothetical protein
VDVLTDATGSDAAEVGSDGGAAGDALSPAQAVQQTLQTNPLCTAINNLYWEIGDVHGALASGRAGVLFGPNTEMNIASASKIVFGAYVVERFKADLSGADFRAMTMRTGYVSLDYTTCVSAATVGDCFQTASAHTAADDDLFFYQGGHFQKYAMDLGLGADDNAALAAEIASRTGVNLAYSSPQLAAGVHTSPAMFATFLQRVLSGALALKDHLGENAVCTLPSACPAALSSPVPEAWHYSWGHWVEDAPGVGDGAFSSPGAFGFYPWIDATKTYYGMLARYALTGNPAVESVACGRLLRKAFLTGVPQ